MTSSSRVFLQLLLPVALSACVATPAVGPQTVAVRADKLTPEHSSFNARVLSDAGNVEHSFAASLDPNIEPLTRLESTYSQQIGSDSAQRIRVGDTISTSGMWGSSVRYGGMQFGTRINPRTDVIAAPGVASEGLAILSTAEEALFTSLGERSATLAEPDVATIAAPTIAATRLVAAGCSDFSVGVGKVRRDYAVLSNEYGPLFANTTVACAVPLGFTIEGHGEYLDDDVAAVGV